MASIKMRIDRNAADTPLPNVFIDQYMPNATPVYVMVYILGLRHCLGGEGVSIKDLAETLKLLASDVINAWRYWEKEGLITILDDNVEHFSIEFKAAEMIGKTAEKAIGKEKTEAAAPYKISLAAQPSYSPKEIDIYMARSDEIRRLFKSAENIFARPLAYTELNMLLCFFEWYALPIDVIEVMLKYCVDQNKRGKNYLEAVARDWSENGIDTVEAAAAYIDTFAGYHQILKAFGITGKTPNKKQTAFIKKWLEEYRLSMAVIIEACETAFLQTGKAQFEYADTMLQDWSKKGIETVADVQKTNDAYRESKKNAEALAQASREVKTPGRQPYKNRFINYEQREWDYEKIEAVAQSML
jgi:DnaD/phage-associated family protein